MKKTGNSLRRDLCVLVIISIIIIGLTIVLSSCAIIGEDVTEIETPSPTSAPSPTASTPTTPGPTAPSTSSSYSTGECIAQNDNWKLTGKDKCAFADTEWFQGATIFEAMSSDIDYWHEVSPNSRGKVYVAVLDYGGVDLEKNLYEIFADGRYIADGHPLEPTSESSCSHMHGVTSIIAADNDGKWMNGLASGILDDRLFLKLVTRDPEGETGLQFLSKLRMAADLGSEGDADVVNISSWSWNLPDSDSVALLKDIFKDFPDTLFVIAAPNTGQEVTERTHMEGAVAQLPNVVLVGGTALCTPTDIRDYSISSAVSAETLDPSAYGPLVHLFAPSDKIPTYCDSGSPVHMFGNSFAAPQVVSLAAVLKYIDPSLTPEQIKSHLLISGAVRGGSRVISFAQAIAQVIAVQADRYDSQEVLDKLGSPDIDFDEVDVKMPFVLVAETGTIMSRLCDEGIKYHVDGVGTHTVKDMDSWFVHFQPEMPLDETWSLGSPLDFVRKVTGFVIEADKFFGVIVSEDDAYLQINCNDCSFKLENEHLISDSEDPGTATVWYLPYPGEEPLDGRGTAGIIQFDSCQIYSRDNFQNSPSVVAVKGSIHGVLRMEIEHGVYDYSDIDGTFRIPAVVKLKLTDEKLCSYLEENCAGGFGKCCGFGKCKSP